LQPRPKSFVSCIKINVHHFFLAMAYSSVCLELIKVLPRACRITPTNDPNTKVQPKTVSGLNPSRPGI
jgi:hypothetical protein